jgi:hypothetical protein
MSRQVSNSVKMESGELLVSITHLALTFNLYEIAAHVFCCFSKHHRLVRTGKTVCSSIVFQKMRVYNSNA